ncbi:MAG: penicillin-binding protein [Lachnospiraceae bacterium]|nr:penicillin-binding protein [Lachnospiraceae bacterium]
MNYGEQQIRRKIKILASPKSRIVNRVKLYSIICFIILLFASLLVLAFCAAGVLRGLVDSAPVLSEVELMPSGYATTIYDADGNVTQTLVGSDANRIYVDIGQIPKDVQHAFIAIEDARFYEHKGIDLKGIIRAVYTGVINREGLEQGASTITQQLLKNQVFGGGNETSFFARFTRKIQEQCLAIDLENNMDKDQILEYYLNTINLGQNTLGVEAASKRYFDKSVSELNISEAAVIAGITQNPTEYNPITQQENNAAKRKLVLKAMLEQKFISEDEYEDALGDDVYSYIRQVNEKKSSEKILVNSYYVDAVIDSVIRDLKQELGYTETQAYNAVYRRGLKIYSCQKKELQDICDSVINNDDYYPKGTVKYLSYTLSVKSPDGEISDYTEKDIQAFYSSNKGREISLYFKKQKSAGKYIKAFKKSILDDDSEVTGERINFIKQPQTSFVLLNQHNGHVQAITGGRGKKVADRTFNRAVSSKRQPGSTFKILSTYLPALDTCGMTLASVEEDAPYKYPGTNITVRNWDGSSYKGFITLRDAIVHSNNVVTVKTFEKVSPQTGFDYLLNLGFSTLVDKKHAEDGKTYTDIQLPTALGGLTDGVTNLELTAAYASIANGGTYIEPVFYTKIIDHDGNVLLKNEPASKKVMKESTAWLLTNAMEDVISYGTGTAAKFEEIGTAQAGKTGTTSDNTDYWFEGYTPYYTAGIWTGYDINTPQPSGDFHKRMWKDIMEKIHKKMKLEEKSFREPEGIISCNICTSSGLLANTGACGSGYDNSQVRTEYFAGGTQPGKKCNLHTSPTETEELISMP